MHISHCEIRVKIRGQFLEYIVCFFFAKKFKRSCFRREFPFHTRTLIFPTTAASLQHCKLRPPAVYWSAQFRRVPESIFSLNFKGSRRGLHSKLLLSPRVLVCWIFLFTDDTPDPHLMYSRFQRNSQFPRESRRVEAAV